MSPLDDVPKRADIEEAWNLNIYDSNSRQVSVASLFSTGTEEVNRVLVVFIRHFFCGNCQEYLRRLTTTFPPSNLPSDLRIAIIGCGSPTLIESYRKVTGCPKEYPIYTDPSLKLYQILGMRRSLSLGSKSPRYIQHSIVSMALKSFVQGLKRLPEGDATNAGGMSVNGGEYVFERDDASDPNSTWSVTWCHKMQNSRNHTEIQDLKEALRLNEDFSNNNEPNRDSDAATDVTIEKPEVTILSNKGFRRSMSVRRQSWMQKAGQLGRSTSLLRRNEVGAL